MQHKELGSTPVIDLNKELKNGKFILELVNQDLALSAHDIGEGGLLVAAAEMSLSSGIGITIDCAKKAMIIQFGEDQGRYLIEIDIQNDDTLKKLSEIMAL